MSFSSYKRNALDAARPLHWRMSNLRSCAMLVGHKYRVRRSVIIERVRQLSGVDITLPLGETEIIEVIDRFGAVHRVEAAAPLGPEHIHFSEAEIQGAVEALLQIKNSGYEASAE